MDRDGVGAGLRIRLGRGSGESSGGLCRELPRVLPERRRWRHVGGFERWSHGRWVPERSGLWRSIRRDPSTLWAATTSRVLKSTTRGTLWSAVEVSTGRLALPCGGSLRRLLGTYQLMKGLTLAPQSGFRSLLRQIPSPTSRLQTERSPR